LKEKKLFESLLLFTRRFAFIFVFCVDVQLGFSHWWKNVDRSIKNRVL